MKDMDEKPRISEDNNAGMVAEPVVATIRSDISTLGYDIDNWPGMPLVGPDNIDEMNARIDQAEQEMANQQGFSWEQVMMEAQSIVNRYETAVY